MHGEKVCTPALAQNSSQSRFEFQETRRLFAPRFALSLIRRTRTAKIDAQLQKFLQNLDCCRSAGRTGEQNLAGVPASASLL